MCGSADVLKCVWNLCLGGLAGFVGAFRQLPTYRNLSLNAQVNFEQGWTRGLVLTEFCVLNQMPVSLLSLSLR